MLILGDEGHYHGRFPWVTASLVFLNVLAFTGQCLIGEKFTNGYSLVPAEITEFRDITRTEYVKVQVAVRQPTARGQPHPPRSVIVTHEVPVAHAPGPFPIALTLFTSMFLHGNPFHLVGNLWFLLIFGRNVECALGHGLFAFFYLFCGLMAGLAHIASGPHSVVPCLGASGAISGVLGAYVAIHPLNKIKVWLGWYFGLVELPALVVIGLWFLGQYLAICRSLEHPEHAGNIAYWAHLGGFVAGLGFIGSTIAALKWQISKMPVEAEVIRDGPSPPDPFASCLPPR